MNEHALRFLARWLKVLRCLKPTPTCRSDAFHCSLLVMVLVFAFAMMMTFWIQVGVGSPQDKVQLQLDPQINAYRILQLEKKVQTLEDQHSNLFGLVIATLTAVIVNMLIYLVTHRQRENLYAVR